MPYVFKNSIKLSGLSTGLFVLLFFGLIFPNLVIAQVSTSTNYSIQFDSVNFGGIRSTSSNYTIEDTAGEVATGSLAGTSYKIKAGYQQMNEVFISASSPGDVTLSPNINGDTGGVANGSAAWIITTDSPAGYTLTVKSSTNPSLISGSNSFADYTPVATDPDFSFSVSTSNSEFGFSPEGSDLVQKYKDNGTVCNSGSNDTNNACWDDLSVTAKTIAKSSGSNQSAGTITTIKFRAEAGSTKNQAAGTYTAVVTVTATAN